MFSICLRLGLGPVNYIIVLETRFRPYGRVAIGCRHGLVILTDRAITVCVSYQDGNPVQIVNVHTCLSILLQTFKQKRIQKLLTSILTRFYR